MIKAYAGPKANRRLNETENNNLTRATGLRGRAAANQRVNANARGNGQYRAQMRQQGFTR